MFYCNLLTKIKPITSNLKNSVFSHYFVPQRTPENSIGRLSVCLTSAIEFCSSRKFLMTVLSENILLCFGREHPAVFWQRTSCCVLSENILLCFVREHPAVFCQRTPCCVLAENILLCFVREHPAVFWQRTSYCVLSENILLCFVKEHPAVFCQRTSCCVLSENILLCFAREILLRFKIQ
jgi:hypothetical protein